MNPATPHNATQVQWHQKRQPESDLEDKTLKKLLFKVLILLLFSRSINIKSRDIHHNLYGSLVITMKKKFGNLPYTSSSAYRVPNGQNGWSTYELAYLVSVN